MKRFIAGAIVGATISSGVAFGAGHRLYATVDMDQRRDVARLILPAGTHEDDFCLDYTGASRTVSGRPELRVTAAHVDSYRCYRFQGRPRQHPSHPGHP